MAGHRIALFILLFMPLVAFSQKKKDNPLQEIGRANSIYTCTTIYTCQPVPKKVEMVAAKHDTIHDVVFVAQDHPFFPLENSALQDFGREMVNRTPEFCTYLPFSNGKELLKLLELFTKQNGYIRNLSIAGHSGYEGFFAEDRSGFHRTGYQMIRQDKVIPLTEKAATISDLNFLIKAGKIRFDPSGVIVLAGCNNAHGENNFSFEMAKVTNLPVVASNHKVDLFNVANKGEELMGMGGSFIVYLPVNGKLLKFDLGTPSIRISHTIQEIGRIKKELMNKQLLSKKD